MLGMDLEDGQINNELIAQMPRALKRKYTPKRQQKTRDKNDFNAKLDINPTLRKQYRLHQLNSSTIERILHAV